MAEGQEFHVFTWGLGKSGMIKSFLIDSFQLFFIQGELGHAFVDKEGVCPFPCPVQPSTLRATSIACGERCTAAITQDKKLFMWGSGKFGRLGSGNEASSDTPVLVNALAALEVHHVSIGEVRCLIHVL